VRPTTDPGLGGEPIPVTVGIIDGNKVDPEIATFMTLTKNPFKNDALSGTIFTE
jgi:hypothetical protein